MESGVRHLILQTETDTVADLLPRNTELTTEKLSIKIQFSVLLLMPPVSASRQFASITRVLLSLSETRSQILSAGEFLCVFLSAPFLRI